MESLKTVGAEQLLNQWGLWVRAGRQLPGLADIQDRKPSIDDDSKWETMNLTDDEALFIDRAVAQLKLHDRAMGEAVFTYHAGRVTHRSLASVMRVSRQKAELLLRSGEAWISGYLQSPPQKQLTLAGQKVVSAL